MRMFCLVAVLALLASPAIAQTGTVTNHSFAIGKGPGVTGFTSLNCAAAQLAVGQAAADPICTALSGDITMTAGGVTAIGSAVVHSSMLNADVFSTAHSWAGQQTFTAPILGTPASGTLTNATGLPISTGVSGLATGMTTFLATPSSANLRAALTDEVGTGAAYFVGGALGTPASATLTNATGLPPSGLSPQAAFTFLGNNTSGAASPSAVDIAALTSKTSPAAGDLLLLSDQAASGAWKKVAVSSIASAGSVSSIAGNTGAFTLSSGVTNSTNDIRLAAKPAFRAHKNGTSQTGIGNTTPTQVTFGTEVFDTGNFFASSTWTPPAGLVFLSAAIDVSGSIAAGSQIAISIRKNGTTDVIQGTIYTDNSTSTVAPCVAGVDIANGTDTYIVRVFIAGLSGTATINGGSQMTYFSGAWLSP